MKSIIKALLVILFLSFIGCNNQNESSQSDASISVPNLDLHTAIYMRDLDIIRQHIKAGSDINILENTRNSTPLITASVLDEPEAAKLLINAGAKINYQNIDGSTALISAAAFGRTKIAQILIDAGAKLDIQNNQGSTALHTAAFLCNTDIVKALLINGSNKEIVNKRGKTAYEAASEPFENAKPVYDMINEDFKSLGVELDYERIKRTRPDIAKLLKQIKNFTRFKSFNAFYK